MNVSKALPIRLKQGTTLCHWCMRASGTIAFDGEPIAGMSTHRIAQKGIGYAPLPTAVQQKALTELHLFTTGGAAIWPG